LSALQRTRNFVGRTIRNTCDRALHPFRARRVRNRLAGRSIERILVLCHGNICRSPLLQAALTRHLAERQRSDVVVSSAGFGGAGRPTPPSGVAVAREMGFDLSAHRSTVLTAADLQRADLIVVMSGGQENDVRWRGAPGHVPVVVLGDVDPEPSDGRTIVDPWNGDESVFRVSYARIDRCAKALAALIAPG
jgi:protein-tyrosine phosphatase